MKTYTLGYPEKENFAVALGNFDGVHIGHTKLINAMTSFGLPTLVYTFYDHPLNVIKGEGTVRVINTRAEKESILIDLGVDALVFEDFSSVRDMSPSDFVDKILINKLSAKEVVCGFNYRFGKKNAGDTVLLKQLLSARGVGLTVIDEVTLDGVGVSSSAVRSALLNSDMERAGEMLGRPYFLKSSVKHGKALGRTLGFPTVNLDFEEGRVVPAYGVYVSRFSFENKSFPAIANVGVRPTVDTDVRPMLEAHVIDFEGDLYGKEVKVELLRKLRDEKKFSDVNELKVQVFKDIETAKKYFQER
ncbi:MAG: bifunctional riboflavin kinase/FAD synthetase [Clostridia bacterium]|nr:bifunctional riboflavin kinase/FAD synthetase [Clostridia bacterium]